MATILKSNSVPSKNLTIPLPIQFLMVHLSLCYMIAIDPDTLIQPQH